MTSQTEKQINPDDIISALPQVTEAKEIDRGGFKIVYSAKINGQDEALKLIHIPKLQNQENADSIKAELIGRVSREIAILKQCQRPEIVKIGTVDVQTVVLDGEEYLVYSEEFLSGKNIHALIRAKKIKNPQYELVHKLTMSLLYAIRELWSFKVIHRDIKPLNVMVTGDVNRPFILLDLGLAFSLKDPRLTISPTNRPPQGTWLYMDPVMLVNSNFHENISFRSDLYTTALTVYEYAAGRHPLAQSDDDLVRTISRIIHDEPGHLVDKRPDLPKEFSKLIDQMMKKSPALRPGNLDLLINNMEGMI